MAQMRFKKDSLEFAMFNEFWKLCQNYWIPDKGDKENAEYWKMLMDEIRAFSEKYKGVSGGMAAEIAMGFAFSREYAEKGSKVTLTITEHL